MAGLKSGRPNREAAEIDRMGRALTARENILEDHIGPILTLWLWPMAYTYGARADEVNAGGAGAAGSGFMHVAAQQAVGTNHQSTDEARSEKGEEREGRQV